MEYSFRFIFGLIVCVVGVVVGLALMGPMSKMVFAAEADWNCTTGSGVGFGAAKLPCTIASLYVPFFVIGIMLGIGGMLMYKGRRPEQDQYDQYNYQNYSDNSGAGYQYDNQYG